ncbi:MAG: PspC domain-containing protein, partial [Chloroflexota bacterium]|nr:PspC domain-containing protein [Chloroflexota bacterium]
MNDRLYRSRDERLLAGVAGGIAERFDLDPSLVRVLWVVLVFASGGLFLLLYIAMALVVPEAPGDRDPWPAWGSQSAPGPGAVPGWSATGSTPGSSAVDLAGTTPAAQAFASTTPPTSDGPAGSGEQQAGSETLPPPTP